MITEEQELIIANIILETDYFDNNFAVKKQTRERMAQGTGLKRKQICHYLNLIQQAENAAFIIQNIMQLTNEFEQRLNNSKQNDAQTFIKK